jgi:DAACS family dicarboxylate/amino acid:cation (Na+ or H+) symporter
MTLLLSGLSVVLGLTLVNVFQPGKHLDPQVRDNLQRTYATGAAAKVTQAEQAKPMSQTLLELIPENPLEEAVNSFNPGQSKGGLLAVMVFSLFVGAAMTLLSPAETESFRSLLDAIFRISLQIIGFAMLIAPFGVACLSFALIATTGWDLLRSLVFYIAVVLGGMAIHQFGVYALAVKFLGNRSPVEFYRRSNEAIVTAFSTSSSNATLPVSLRVAEQELGLPPKVARFVLTVGASANQNGTALYEGVTVLFLAQVFGVELSLAQQITVALMCILAGVGTAGVPGGSLPLVVGVLISINVPAQSIAIILGIDRVLDMCRTVLNVTGDLVIATVVSRGVEREQT